jgi:hypothetical protein
MNVEMLKLIVAASIMAIVLCVFRWQAVDSYRAEVSAKRRAEELLLAVLTTEQYCQLTRLGYIDIKSPHDHERIYRVPRGPGLVRVIEGGKETASLCLHPLEKLPDADSVVMHTLMIEADEETYVQTANRFVPLGINYRED